MAPITFNHCINALSARSEPETVYPWRNNTSAIPAIPTPPIPTKWTCFICPISNIQLNCKPPHKYGIFSLQHPYIVIDKLLAPFPIAFVVIQKILQQYPPTDFLLTHVVE